MTDLAESVGPRLWKRDVHAYLGMRGDAPVACAATAPEWQRRGYREAVTRKALNDGALATGLTCATLRATVAGAHHQANASPSPRFSMQYVRKAWALATMSSFPDRRAAATYQSNAAVACARRSKWSAANRRKSARMV